LLTLVAPVPTDHMVLDIDVSRRLLIVLFALWIVPYLCSWMDLDVALVSHTRVSHATGIAIALSRGGCSRSLSFHAVKLLRIAKTSQPEIDRC